MVSYSANLDSRTKQHTQFGVSASNGSRDMARTKVAEKKRRKNEHGQNHIASPTGIANGRERERARQRSIYVALSATKVRMTAMTPPHHLVTKNWVCSV